MKPTRKMTSGPCIWMASGVTRKKTCTWFFDCSACKYDRAMETAAAAGRHLTWQEAMRTRDSRDRVCRHTLTGRSDPRICPMNYNCSRCDFDQTFEEALWPAAVHVPGQMKTVKGFALPSDHFFHTGHAWARMEPGGFIRVGMDDFALKVLGAPTGLDLPLMGQELHQGEPGWGIRRQDFGADVASPVSGIITAVNRSAARRPFTLAQAPYEAGWLFTIHHPAPKETLGTLLDDDQSSAWLDREVHDLEGMIQETFGPLATDGGFLAPDVFGSLPALGWHTLTRRFLGT